MMITYVGRDPTATTKRQAAIVIPDPGIDEAALLSEITDAIRNARLVGWKLSGVSDLERSVLDSLNRIARFEDTLLVIVDAQPALARRLEIGKLSNITLGENR